MEEQKRSFAIIALLIACAAALLSLPLARQMVKRIKALATATHRLTSGRYDTRLKATGQDELGRLTEEFNILANTLKQNELMRQKWFGDISHELRTPLAVLRGEIEAFQDKVRKLTPETLDSLHAEVRRLERLVGDLFQLSMSDIGALTYRKEEVDLIVLIDEAVETYRSRFSAKDISMTVRQPPDGQIIVFADSGRLQQLFKNPLTNSFKYTDTGGRLDIELERRGDRAIIAWQDSAPGVGPAEIERLFDRLYRVESSRNRATGGAGLGLAISKNVVEAHGGSIFAESSHLGGLLITISLPLTGAVNE